MTAFAHFEKNDKDQPIFWLSSVLPAASALEAANNPAPPPTAASRLLQLLSLSPLTFGELVCELSDLAHGSVRNVLQHLLITRLVERSDGGSRGQKASYRLTQQGAEVFAGKSAQNVKDPLPS